MGERKRAHAPIINRMGSDRSTLEILRNDCEKNLYSYSYQESGLRQITFLALAGFQAFPKKFVAIVELSNMSLIHFGYAIFFARSSTPSR